MLSPREFSVGCIGDATIGLTLFLPRDSYEYPMLVTQASGSPYAIVLTGDYQFTGFECSNNETWKGVLIPNVGIEIDQTSVFEADHFHAPLGSLVRRNAQLDIVTKVDGGFRRTVKTPLIVDLPSCRQNMTAGFTKWGIFLGEGVRKRELMIIDIGTRPAN